MSSMADAVIVIVEDNLGVADFYVDLLTEHGYQARSFPDGPSFLATLATLSPDLLIVDRNMPGLDGLEVARRVRGVRPNLPILMVSGAGVRPITSKAGGIVDRYLGKPCTIQQFIGAVSELLAPLCRTAGESPPVAAG